MPSQFRALDPKKKPRNANQIQQPASPTIETPVAHLINQAESAPGELTPQNVLQLQRTVGNRAACTRVHLASVVQRAPMPVTQTTPQLVIQRKSLDELYGELAADDSEKQKYLADFKKIKTLLGNKNATLTLIKQGVLQDDQWEQGLADFEDQKGFSAARPALIGLVPAQFFRSMVGGGQAFEDMLGRGHGIHSHRMQWHAVGQDIQQTGGYHHSVAELYKEAGNPFWQKDGSYIWDEIVDRQDTMDLTSPEWVTFNLAKESNFHSMEEDDKGADSTREGLLELWATDGPKDNKQRGIFDQVPVGEYIFTGFTKKSKDDEESPYVPTVVYQTDDQAEIPTG